MASRTVKLKDIRSATEASIKAVLGKRFVSRPGVLVGLWIDRTAIGKLGAGANQIAKDVARQVSVTSGIRVVPGIRPVRGGVLVGYIQPKLFK
jgi:hypothetical protein